MTDKPRVAPWTLWRAPDGGFYRGPYKSMVRNERSSL
jgi:hypothetical protein